MTVGQLRLLIEPLTDDAELVVAVHGRGGVIRPYSWGLEREARGGVRAVLDIQLSDNGGRS